MATMGNLLVKDDATTPIEFTLEPITDTPFPLWRGSATGVSREGQIRHSVMQETLKNGTLRTVSKTEVPVMETLGAAGSSAGYVAPQKVAYVNTVITTMFSDGRATIADQANAYKIHHAIQSGASATTAVGVLNGASAGDAFKNSVLPIPLSFIKAVLPS